MTRPDAPLVVRTVEALRQQVRSLRGTGARIALVPTMGALHEGHLTLVRRAREVADYVVVSLFVNPTQFGPNEDLARYPRDEDGDRRLLAEEGVQLLFAPDAEVMYPEGACTRVLVPSMGDILEGEFRPGFFTGVATVVTKLLLQVLPDIALFGEKDYQQSLVVRRMVADLFIPVEIITVPTVREDDGLALSSRNAYLSPEERAAAPMLYRILNSVADDVRDGADPIARAERGATELLKAGFTAVDYLEVRNAETLLLWGGPTQLGRVLVAARIGSTRLIDNIPL